MPVAHGSSAVGDERQSLAVRPTTSESRSAINPQRKPQVTFDPLNPPERPPYSEDPVAGRASQLGTAPCTRADLPKRCSDSVRTSGWTVALSSLSTRHQPDAFKEKAIRRALAEATTQLAKHSVAGMLRGLVPIGAAQSSMDQ
jgi:hypothetical protein